MPVTQDRLTRLREFGLSEYAARAYLALLDLGIAEARDVSSISKVPQAKIYHVLEQLHEKGLAVVLPEFPKKYAPVPFVEYLDRLYEEHTRVASSIESERDALAELFRVMGDTDVGDRGFFTVLRGRRNVLAKIEEMVASTKHDLLVLGTRGSAGRSSRLLPDLVRAKERGAAMRFLAPLDADTLGAYRELLPFAEVRARELDEGEQSAKVAIVVADGRSALIIHFVPDDASMAVGKDVGVYTDQEAMVAAIQAIVEPHWRRAARYEDRRQEIEMGRAAPFTRVYAQAADAWKAYDEALSRGVKELCVLDGEPAASPNGAARAVAERLRSAGGSFRAVLNLPDAESVEAHQALMDAAGGEVRHLAPRLVSRQWLVDEREAFLSLSRQGGRAADVVIHTNDPLVVAAARDHFEAFWSAAAPLAQRRKDLTSAADMGAGFDLLPVLDALEEAVLLAEPDGRVVAVNAAAEGLVGRPARLADLLGGDIPRSGAGDVRRADGSVMKAEWTVRAVTTGRPLLLVVVRAARGPSA